jgi:hypothetical protein
MRKTAAALIAAILITVVNTQFALANPHPWNTLFVNEGDVSLEAGPNPPIVRILSPQNDSLHQTGNVTFNVNVTLLGSPLIFHFGYLTYEYASPHLDSVYYEADWLANYTYVEPPLSLSLNLTGIPEGNRSLVVYAVEWRASQSNYDAISDVYYYKGLKITGSSVVKFIVDFTPPEVTVLSVQNKTYSSSDIPLDIEVNDSISKLSYVLDGGDNVTISENATLSGLLVGLHNVTVYVWDAAGNVGASETVSFTVAEPESFPTVLVAAVSAASITAVAAGLLFTRRKRHKEAKHA